MLGIGIVIYNNLVNKDEFIGENESDIYEVLCQLITTIQLFTTEDYILIIRDNDSLDYRFNRFNITLRDRFNSPSNIIFIKSKVNNLTDGWNEILDITLNQYHCYGTILLNQDILLTKYWNNYTEILKIQSRDLIGPLTNNVTFQTNQLVTEDNFAPQDTLTHVPAMQGFCLGGSKTCFIENMYSVNNKEFFNPQTEWDFNEEEWIQRNNKTGGRCLVLNNAYIIHLNNGSWRWNERKSTTIPDTVYPTKYRNSVLNVLDYNKYIEEQNVI
jgi:hypothetical protein